MTRDILPFTAAHVEAQGWDPSQCVYLEVVHGTSVYAAVCRFLAANACATSFSPLPKRAPLPLAAHLSPEEREQEEQRLTLGLGVFPFRDLLVIHQNVGDPLANSHGTLQHRTLVLMARGTESAHVLSALVEEAEAWHARGIRRFYRTFMFSFQMLGWQHVCLRAARSKSSLILSDDVSLIFDDVQDFVRPERRMWYHERGIPYKRTYLLHGPPGTGKSSLIQVLAGVLGRSLCLLQPVHPKMTDDLLTSSLLSAMRNSIIVMEDIDALFSAQREMAGRNTSLTFSGLLNALDGVATAEGQIFILTTNYPDRLDAALVRPGRVDRAFEMRHATPDQVYRMFLLYYPGEESLAASFRSEVSHSRALVDGPPSAGDPLSLAELQGQFLTYSQCAADAFLRCHDIR